jgi:DNA-directed RNA polymerase specialized sigma24 family protein
MTSLPTDWGALAKSARIWAASKGAATDDIEDVAQDALLKLWRRAQAGAAWPNEAALYRFLHLCVRSVLADAGRRRNSAVGALLWAASLEAETDDDGPIAQRLPGGDAERDGLARAELDAALLALAGLGRPGRAVALSASGLDVREIAPLLSVAPRTVYAELATGRAALRGRLGYESTTTCRGSQ